MSVYTEFQKAWRVRFPGKDLPGAWEEDVRANLAKHRARAAVLREDLEKEQFYVEYLERLLVDVQRHSLVGGEEERGECEGSSTPFNIQDHVVEEAINSVIAEHSASGRRHTESNGSTVKNLTRRFNKNNTKSRPPGFLRSTSVPGSTVTPPSQGKNHRLSHCESTSSFVTVIPITGGDEDNRTETVTMAKKTPPAVPPKSYKHRLGSHGDVEPRPPAPLPHKILPTYTDDFPNPNSLHKSISSSSSGSDRPVVFSSRPQPPKTLQSDSEEEDDDEPLYDTVAPDEVDSCSSPFDTLKSGGSGGSLASRSGGSGGALSSPSTSPGPSPSHYRNYVNIDFFLQRQRKDIRVPEAEDSEEEEEGPKEEQQKRRQSLSSDHEEEDVIREESGLDIDSGVYGSSVESASLIPSVRRSRTPPDKQPNNLNSVANNNVSSTNGGVLRHPSSISTLSTSSLATSNSITSSSITKSNSNKSSGSDCGSISSNDKSVGGARRWGSLSDVIAEDPVLAEAQHLTMCRCIIASILESETVYLECLQVVLQYMKALKATLITSQPVISPDDFSTIFYRIPELYSAHKAFLEGLKDTTSEHSQSPSYIGDLFQNLAQKLEVYSQYLTNYSRAVETVRRCSSESSQFSDLTRAIKLKSSHGHQAHTLEELLHRPVARVQKNALVLHDLLKHTPQQDSGSLNEALRLFQSFLSEFSLIQTETMFPMCDRQQRHLVRNSFIVELVDGHRKLRHLFLFNDVLLCAKYKATNRADKFTFDLKWFISLHDILVLEGNNLEQFRETNPPNLVNLKSQAATVRDQLRRLEHSSSSSTSLDKSNGSNGATGGGGGILYNSRVEKLRKRLSELEAQLILASPSLPWRVSRRGVQLPHFTFLLSSQYERQQWTDAVSVLQNNSPGMGGDSLTAQELQGWITAYRSFLKTNMGNFLMRSGRDEPLLLGDLHIVVKTLTGLNKTAKMFLAFEVDSYGHFFRKAKTRVLESSEPHWNQDFIIELEGSQTLRILCYEETENEGVKLWEKAQLDLSTSWLCDSLQERTVTLKDLQLSIQIKHLAPEATLRRVPTSKPHGLFGTQISAVCKREKRSVPFVVTRCVREVERRGMTELGIYRVSGMTSDISRLKKSFETNPYEAEQLIKEVDIHSVTGLLKLFLRELPEALFTSELYPRFFDAYVSNDHDYRKSTLLSLFSSLPQLNQSIIAYLLEHLVKIFQLESVNKMSLHNLATVFGPTLVRPAAHTGTPDPAELLAAGTVDVMAQAGLLHFFLHRRANGEPIQIGGSN